MVCYFSFNRNRRENDETIPLERRATFKPSTIKGILLDYKSGNHRQDRTWNCKLAFHVLSYKMSICYIKTTLRLDIFCLLDIVFCQGLAFDLCVSALLIRKTSRLRQNTHFARLSPPVDSRCSILTLRTRGLFLTDRVKPSLWQRLVWTVEVISWHALLWPNTAIDNWVTIA